MGLDQCFLYNIDQHLNCVTSKDIKGYQRCNHDPSPTQLTCRVDLNCHCQSNDHIGAPQADLHAQSALSRDGENRKRKARRGC